MLSQIPQWVALYTNSRAEKRVAELLEQQGYECYLPIIERRHKWSDRYKMVKEPLFRSYVFARLINTDVDNIRKIQGVCMIVAFGGEIVTIPEDQIDAVRRLVESKEELTVMESSAMKKGAKVKITEGQFAGMVGTLVSNCKDGNFEVRIDAIGLSLVTRMDRLLLKPLVSRRRVAAGS